MKNIFKLCVLEYVRKIPQGETRSYKEVARACGNEKAFRGVGAILKTNYDPNIPCHRVIRSDGRLGGYNRGREKKKILLEKERRM
jgi:O-6-methylguanine DNA methyltransferase